MFRAHKLGGSQQQPLVAAVNILSHRLAELYDAGSSPPPPPDRAHALQFHKFVTI